MKKHLRLLVSVAVGAAASLAFTSCAYDPYYSSSVGGSYSSGYGDGYGYGGSSFNTSLFISTGDPRWGYDPNCYSYYDYHRRCYYDPYLNGYYPVGYRPAVVYGVPHPYGWRPGHGYCPPPRSVTNVTVVNYRNRESAYRNTSYGWSKQVRQAPNSSYRPQGQRPSIQPEQYKNQRPSYNNGGSNSRPTYDRQGQMRNSNNQVIRPSGDEYRRQQQQAQARSRYNQPVSDYSRPQAQRNRSERSPQLGSPGNIRQAPRSQPQERPQQSKQGKSSRNKGDGDGKQIRGYR